MMGASSTRSLANAHAKLPKFCAPKSRIWCEDWWQRSASKRLRAKGGPGDLTLHIPDGHAGSQGRMTRRTSSNPPGTTAWVLHDVTHPLRMEVEKTVRIRPEERSDQIAGPCSSCSSSVSVKRSPELCEEC